MACYEVQKGQMCHPCMSVSLRPNAMQCVEEVSSDFFVFLVLLIMLYIDRGYLARGPGP